MAEDQPKVNNIRFFLWASLAAMTALVVVLVLVPYYGTGMHYPSTPPDTFPDRQDEVYSISLFRGSLWEGQPWRDIFWNVGCFGWCLWLPLIIAAILESTIFGQTLSSQQRLLRFAGFAVLALVGILWFLAAGALMVEYAD